MGKNSVRAYIAKVRAFHYWLSGLMRNQVLYFRRDTPFSSASQCESRLEPPVYLSQFADRDRVSDFLKDPSLLLEDAHWERFGFKTKSDYAFWAPRLCGVICLKMVLDLRSTPGETVASITSEGVDGGGYVIELPDGTPADRGWYYRPLVEMAERRGFKGKVFSGWSFRDVREALIGGAYVVLSVHPAVIRGDIDRVPDGASGGHLVVVFGCVTVDDVLSFEIHNPSGRTPETQESFLVSARNLAEASAGRGFVLTPPGR